MVPWDEQIGKQMIPLAEQIGKQMTLVAEQIDEQMDEQMGKQMAEVMRANRSKWLRIVSPKRAQASQTKSTQNALPK